MTNLEVMNTTSKTKCEELQEALDAARAAIETPREHADATIGGGTVTEAGATDPGSVQPDLLKEIEDIQQAMREAGCT